MAIALLPESIAALRSLGFSPYKTRGFVRINQDMLVVVSYQGVRSDIYWWWAAYPLVLPVISLGSGFSNAAGRIPTDKKGLSADDELITPEKKLHALLMDQLIPLLRSCNTMEALLSKYTTGPIGARYPQAFCLFALGRTVEARSILESIAQSADFNRYLQDQKDVVRYYRALSDPAIVTESLALSRRENIRRLRLSKYLAPSLP